MTRVFDAREVRIAQDEAGNLWWSARDVCGSLGIKNYRSATERLDPDEKALILLDASFRESVVNESGLYTLVLRSNKPQAKRFRRWVTEEVLPSIRKTGSYTTAALSPEEMLLHSAQILVDQKRRIEKQEQAVKLLSERVDDVRDLVISRTSTNSADTGFMTVRGFCNVRNIRLDLKGAQRFGQGCSKLARAHGIQTGLVSDEAFGMVKSYPLGILEETASALGLTQGALIEAG